MSSPTVVLSTPDSLEDALGDEAAEMPGRAGDDDAHVRAISILQSNVVKPGEDQAGSQRTMPGEARR
ncbi:MAG: hypothetical protein ACXWWL_02435 [Candidatus Limnocylindria bacterium]